MPRPRTRQAQLEREITQAGEIRSLFRLAEGLGISYWYAWVCLSRLEELGRVEVDRSGRGRALVIRPVSETCQGD